MTRRVYPNPTSGDYKLWWNRVNRKNASGKTLIAAIAWAGRFGVPDVMFSAKYRLAKGLYGKGVA